jgi:hypothetical protein
LRAGGSEALRDRSGVAHPARSAIVQFETVPAWRIARLRLALRDAEQRGLDLQDAGGDLIHRALVRRFAQARQRAHDLAAHPPRKVSTTRKGRNFPLAKRVAIWRAIFATRPANWTQGDRAPFGAIVEAHRQAAAECAALNIASPRYRSVYMLWHRGVPGADVIKALNRP